MIARCSKATRTLSRVKPFRPPLGRSVQHYRNTKLLQNDLTRSTTSATPGRDGCTENQKPGQGAREGAQGARPRLREDVARAGAVRRRRSRARELSRRELPPGGARGRELRGG